MCQYCHMLTHPIPAPSPSLKPSQPTCASLSCALSRSRASLWRAAAARPSERSLSSNASSASTAARSCSATWQVRGCVCVWECECECQRGCGSLRKCVLMWGVSVAVQPPAVPRGRAKACEYVGCPEVCNMQPLPVMLAWAHTCCDEVCTAGRWLQSKAQKLAPRRPQPPNQSTSNRPHLFGRQVEQGAAMLLKLADQPPPPNANPPAAPTFLVGSLSRARLCCSRTRRSLARRRPSSSRAASSWASASAC